MRVSTCHRRVRSTMSYAFWRSMKHMKRDIPAFGPISCSLRTTNIMSAGFRLDMRGQIGNGVVGTIVLSPTDAASQEGVVGSAQRVDVARAGAPCNAAVQHCSTLALSVRILSSSGALSRSYSSRVYFRKLHHALHQRQLTSMDRLALFVVDVPPEVYQLVRFVVHLARCL